MLIVPQKLKIKWFYKTRKHYESKGYIFTKWYDQFEVDVQDLSEGCHEYVNVKCDYCGNKISRTYKDHVTITNRDLVKKDCCTDCQNIKNKEILEYKQNIGMLIPEANGYWTFHENRLLELQKYIDKHGDVENLYSSEDGFIIWKNFSVHNHDIVEAVKELEYDIKTFMKRMPIGYYDDFNKVKERIQEFIDEHNRFPTINELAIELNLTSQQMKKHGGINEIKRKMNYCDENDLRDDNGWYNNSYYEYIVAQYLINNTNVKYKREQHPFPSHEGDYRSDFTFYLENGVPYHIEVWGYRENHKDESATKYIRVKNKKVKLYNKYKINLISIEADIFINKSLKQMQDSLHDIFKPYLDLKLKYIENEILIRPNSLDDKELLDLLMGYSEDKNYLPKVQSLKNSNKYSLYEEVIKRYDNYHVFASKFNKKVYIKRNYWTKELIFKEFKNILSNNDYLCKTRLNELGMFDLVGAIDKSGGIINLKLEFYNKEIDNLIFLHDKEKTFLNNVANNKGTRIKNKVSLEQQHLAQKILIRLNQPAS